MGYHSQENRFQKEKNIFFNSVISHRIRSWHLSDVCVQYFNQSTSNVFYIYFLIFFIFEIVIRTFNIFGQFVSTNDQNVKKVYFIYIRLSIFLFLLSLFIQFKIDTSFFLFLFLFFFFNVNLNIFNKSYFLFKIRVRNLTYFLLSTIQNLIYQLTVSYLSFLFTFFFLI